MPRRPRMCLAGVPSHVVTRGNNHQQCFFSQSDFHFYLECLFDALERHNVSLHAYVLMTNHVHLLMTPDNETGIPMVMQSIGRRYVQYINRRLQRSGTLFEGRYRSSLVTNERYVLACYLYIELNPVRAQIVQHPGEYSWSSYQANGEGRRQRLVTMHDMYLNLGGKGERCKNYRELINQNLETKLESHIRSAALFSQPLENIV